MLTHQGWLPVCGSSSSYWFTPESRVLCRQLGYDVVTSNPSKLHYEFVWIWIIIIIVILCISNLSIVVTIINNTESDS